MSEHPEDDVLLAYADGELAEDARAPVRAHVAACAECGARLRDVRDLEASIAAAAAATRASADVPPALAAAMALRERRALHRPAQQARRWPWLAAAAAAVALAVLWRGGAQQRDRVLEAELARYEPGGSTRTGEEVRGYLTLRAGTVPVWLVVLQVSQAGDVHCVLPHPVYGTYGIALPLRGEVRFPPEPILDFEIGPASTAFLLVPSPAALDAAAAEAIVARVQPILHDHGRGDLRARLEAARVALGADWPATAVVAAQ